MNLPGLRLHALQENLKGFWSASVPEIGESFSGSKNVKRAMSIESITIEESQRAMRMHNPPYPGEIIEADCLDPLELSVTEGAKAHGVTRQLENEIQVERCVLS